MNNLDYVRDSMREKGENVISIFNIFEACMESSEKLEKEIENVLGSNYNTFAKGIRKAAEDAQKEIPPTVVEETRKNRSNVYFFMSPLITGLLDKMNLDFPDPDPYTLAVLIFRTHMIDNAIKDSVGQDNYAKLNVYFNNAYKECLAKRNAHSGQISPFCRSLMDEAMQNDLPFIGREDVIDRTVQILNRKLKHNVIHIGESGVGKTSCTIGLARRILSGNVPDKLKNTVIYSLDVAGMMAGTKFRGEMEERLKSTLDKLEKQENAILYIDEIQTIVGAGASTESNLDASNILKPYLTRGKIRVIGSATLDDYRKTIEKDNALCRRFQTVKVEEPSEDEAVKMLMGLKSSFENYHKLTISDKAVKSAVILSKKHINDKYLPDKAVDVLDEACSLASLNGKEFIDENDILDTVSRICRIPSENLKKSDTDKLKSLYPSLSENIFGQDTAIKLLNRCILSSRAGLSEEKKPVASLLFVGPTGVGKTETARVLAKTLDVKFIKYDMSEYSDQTSVNKLIGASAGYVGYEDGGRLVRDIRENPYCVLLLDEIEKADSSVYNALLQIMDDATLTDNKGLKADFTNVILIMTSNCGAADVKNKLGFSENQGMLNTSGIEDAVKHTFSPEFRSRLTATVMFNQMDKAMAEKIAERQLDNLSLSLSKKSVKVKFTETVIPGILEKCGSNTYGGREIKKVCEEIKELFVDELLFGELHNGGSATVKYKNGNFTLTVRKKPVKKSADSEIITLITDESKSPKGETVGV